jgi:hypothetical protein
VSTRISIAAPASRMVTFDFNLNQVVVYAVQNMRNSLRRSSMPLEQLADEVAFQRECLAKIEATTKILSSGVQTSLLWVVG